MKRRMDTTHFFNEEEKERLKATTHDVESRTMGEIVVMVVESSDPYIEAGLFGGIFLGCIPSLFLTALYFDSSVWSFILLSFVLFFPAQWIVRRFDRLKVWLIGGKRKEDAVRRRALTAFYEKGLYKTKKNTGVLFLLSLLERKVWVLADKGIYEKIGQETLNRFAKIVSQGIKEGQACNALCQALQEVGELLSKYFPIEPGDINELPDTVMTE